MSLQALIDGVERAEFDATNTRPARFNQFMRMAEAAIPDDSRGLCGIAWKAFKGSSDAALALHNALLPGWGWAMEATSAACVWHPDTHGVSRDIELSETPARALLLAILRALQAKGGAA